MKLTDFKSSTRSVFSIQESDNKTTAAYDIVRHFVEIHSKFPYTTSYYCHSNPEKAMPYDTLVQQLLERGAEVVNCVNVYGVKDDANVVSSVTFLLDGVFFQISGTIYKPVKELQSKDVEKLVKVNNDKHVRVVMSLALLHTTMHLPDAVRELLDSVMVTAEKRLGNLGIISRDMNGFYVNETPIEQVTSTDELDLYYGEGFSVFHEKLVHKLATTNKGLTLLHGEPGSGKSTYIRKMIVDIQSKTTKKIVIVPNHMIDCLADPEFSTFLLQTSQEAEMDEMEVGYIEEEIDKGIILILEDAESVLQHRSGINTGTASLLNLTNGLLNDIFGVQIIATYNTDDKNIDPAVKRSQRLIADRYFDKLSVEEAKLLAKHIGADPEEVTKPMSVADLYSLKDKDVEDVLIQSRTKKPAAKKIGF